MSALALPAPALPLSLTGSLSAALARLRSMRLTMELRIDVQPSADHIEAELEALHRRLTMPGNSLRGLSLLPAAPPGFAFHHREADGEHYIYVEDVLHKRLAGYTVFNRLVEVNRRIDPYVRGPHSKYAPAYQRRGLATAVYQWALERGFFLVSGARQSEGAHALWRSLGRRYPLGQVALHGKELRFLGMGIPREPQDDLHTRMMLFGKGCTLEKLQGCASRSFSMAQMTRARVTPGP